MGRSKHEIVRRIVKRAGCRTEYRIVFNGRELKGKVIRTFRKGVETWTTHFRGQQVDHYDPEWLCKRNCLTVKIPVEHPAMWGVRKAA